MPISNSSLLRQKLSEHLKRKPSKSQPQISESQHLDSQHLDLDISEHIDLDLSERQDLLTAENLPPTVAALSPGTLSESLELFATLYVSHRSLCYSDHQSLGKRLFASLVTGQQAESAEFLSPCILAAPVVCACGRVWATSLMPHIQTARLLEDCRSITCLGGGNMSYSYDIYRLSQHFGGHISWYQWAFVKAVAAIFNPVSPKEAIL